MKYFQFSQQPFSWAESIYFKQNLVFCGAFLSTKIVVHNFTSHIFVCRNHTCIIDTSYMHCGYIHRRYVHHGYMHRGYIHHGYNHLGYIIQISWKHASWIHELHITDTCIIDIEVDNEVVVSVNFACGTPPERPKGAKDEVKRSEGPPPRSRRQFIFIWRLLSTENESLSRFFCLRVETKFYI